MSADNKQSSLKILAFAAIICLVCSLVVSFAAVNLRSKQVLNADNEKKINILVAAGLIESGDKPDTNAINQLYKQILPIVVNFKTGQLVSNVDPQNYDMYAAADDPSQSTALTVDPAHIGRIANNGEVYVLIKDNNIDRIILPIQGYGLWSTMYGFTSLSFKNHQPVLEGITFYQQGETPGLGGRITEAAWQKKWQNVLPYDSNGNPNIVLSKNRNPNHKNEVDALAGATLTSNGVQHLMNFWLGSQGFKVFLDNIQQGAITVEAMENQQNTKKLKLGDHDE